MQVSSGLAFFLNSILVIRIPAHEHMEVRFIQQAQERPDLPVELGNKERLLTGHTVFPRK